MMPRNTILALFLLSFLASTGLAAISGSERIRLDVTDPESSQVSLSIHFDEKTDNGPFSRGWSFSGGVPGFAPTGSLIDGSRGYGLSPDGNFWAPPDYGVYAIAAVCTITTTDEGTWRASALFGMNARTAGMDDSFQDLGPGPELALPTSVREVEFVVPPGGRGRVVIPLSATLAVSPGGYYEIGYRLSIHTHLWSSGGAGRPPSPHNVDCNMEVLTIH